VDASSPTGPELATADLYDRRDLRPTGALDAAIAGAVAESLVFNPDRVRRGLFTRATRERRLAGLLRA